MKQTIPKNIKIIAPVSGAKVGNTYPCIDILTDGNAIIELENGEWKQIWKGDYKACWFTDGIGW